MLLVTSRGSYCVVAHAGDPALVLLRSRAEDDLLALRDLVPGLEAQRDWTAGYAWRAELPRDEWSDLAAALAREVDYETFDRA